MILGITSKKKYDKIINVGIITVLDWLCGFIFVAFRLSLKSYRFFVFYEYKRICKHCNDYKSSGYTWINVCNQCNKYVFKCIAVMKSTFQWYK